MKTFAESFDPAQARMWPEQMKRVFGNYVDFLIANGLSMQGITLLQTALTRFQTTPETLTPLHAMLAKLCLLSYMHTVMLPILAIDISVLNPREMANDVEDVLLYLYYGGMVYMGLRRFREAQDMFVAAISAPANVLSAIVLEAYKKYVLVSLIVDGKQPSLPKRTATQVARGLKSLASIYDQFAQLYAKYELSATARAIELNQELFKADNNYGLVQECLAAQQRFVVKRLTRTYLTLSLADIARHAELPDANAAERIVLQMVENGQVCAQINQADNMVTFLEPAEQFDTTKARLTLDQHIQMVQSLTIKVAAADKEMLLSTTYQTKLLQQSARGGREKGPPGLSGSMFRVEQDILSDS